MPRPRAHCSPSPMLAAQIGLPMSPALPHTSSRLPALCNAAHVPALTYGIDEVGAVRVGGVAEDETRLAHIGVADGDHLERVFEHILRPRDGLIQAAAGHHAEPLLPVSRCV